VCLQSSRGSILVNGSPTEEFQFFKGLKQGDPLSPFLFILVMESLHLSFQRVIDAGLYSGLKINSSVNISHLFYADDAIFIGQWSDLNIDTLVRVLDCFFRASGLRINMCKSKILGINVEASKVQDAANKLGCLILKTPFIYLGTRVGGNMCRKEAWNEVVDKMLSRLSRWKMKTLSIGGRLTLIKSVLGSMSIFFMSIYKIPLNVLKTLESIRSRFFNGHDSKTRKTSWVKWDNVLTPKEKGGLGVSSLYALNRGLMFKWVWRFYSQNNSLWSNVIKAIHGPGGKIGKHVTSSGNSCWLMIVKEMKSLKDRGVDILNCIRLKVGNGDASVFWDDHWCVGGILKDLFPRIYALETRKDATVKTKISDSRLDNSFRRKARSGTEESQYNALLEILQGVILGPTADRFRWELENDGEFSVASVRKLIDDVRFQEIGESTKWLKTVPIKVNVTAWRIKTESLQTRFNLSRRGIDIGSIMCPLCSSGVETTSHLFFQCDMARQLTNKVTSWWNVDRRDVNSFKEWRNWMVAIRIHNKLKGILEGVFYGLWWMVWNFRNKFLFDSKKPYKAVFFDNLVSMSYNWCKFRCKASFKWNDWLKNPYLISF
ncbi:RNA-directed DNA polymerase, eukaryota, reverse transcriptase zinc-binding domain protein, partial [Tanacetum coccineum]